MPTPTVEVEHISKRYARKSLQRPGVAGATTARWTRSEPFWALRDVSFTVNRGEALGLIGHNGAGKSTLLRILSRLCLPTEGRAVIRGRVASLLDLAAGFHPELTGRENIVLKSVLLGVRRRDARERTDEIADWAGVRPFMDMPVKRYSNGMRVRLAFSVTVYALPEILFLDEVMGVGDEEFRARSTERMQRLIRDGRTVLFVSHSAGAVRSVCERCVRLDHGRVVDQGPTDAVMHRYTRGAGVEA